MNRTCRALALVMAAGCTMQTVSAQEPRWEVEGYGGLVAARTASDGRTSLPPAGAPLVTSNPLFPTREVPTWFFGDGASLLNAVNEEFGGASRIAALDPLFARVQPGRSAAAGLRVRRWVSARTAFEAGVDFLGDASLAPPDLAAAVEAARRSFGDTFAELLQSGPFTSVAIEATAAAVDDARRDVALTAAFTTDLAGAGAVTPYLTFGGGVVTGIGTLPSAQLSGRYRFSVLGQVPIDESDRVTVRFERPITFTGVIGGGVRRDVTERWTLRIDARAFIGPDTTRVRVTAAPSNQRGTPAGFVESFTNPAIQFSSDPAIGRRSSLSAASLEDVTAFKGGFQTRTVIAVAIARRF